MMYAIIESGGKQYKAEEGRWLDVELLHQPDGTEVTFPVFMLVDGSNVQLGSPSLSSVTVQGRIQQEIKGRKVVSFKFRAKKGYQRKVGHRQRYSRVLIEKISVGETTHGT